MRLAAVLARSHITPHGDVYDVYFYSNGANLLVEGKGYINPLLYLARHQVVPSAAFPPLFTWVLSVASLVGLKSFLAHRVWASIVASAAMPLAAMLGRDIAGGDTRTGRRVGLIAAVLIALYPNIWIADQAGTSEALSPVLVLGVLLAAYRFWRRPAPLTTCVLGGVIGLAALGRDELSLLGVFILVPLALGARGLRIPRRLGLVVLGALAAFVVLGPWVGYNLSRFQKPVYVSSGLGVTLASANCDYTWNGRFTGYWSMPCALAVPIKPGVDESVQGSIDQNAALSYVKAHLGSAPRVAAARVGRAFAFYNPIDQLRLDDFIESRPALWSHVGLWMYYSLFSLALYGLAVTRRRRVPIFPLLMIGLDVIIAVVVTFGQTRYRITFEVSLVLLASVALERIATRLFAVSPQGATDAAPAGPGARTAPLAAG